MTEIKTNKCNDFWQLKKVMLTLKGQITQK